MSLCYNVRFIVVVSQDLPIIYKDCFRVKGMRKMFAIIIVAAISFFEFSEQFFLILWMIVLNIFIAGLQLHAVYFFNAQSISQSDTLKEYLCLKRC